MSIFIPPTEMGKSRKRFSAKEQIPNGGSKSHKKNIVEVIFNVKTVLGRLSSVACAILIILIQVNFVRMLCSFLVSAKKEIMQRIAFTEKNVHVSKRIDKKVPFINFNLTF